MSSFKIAFENLSHQSNSIANQVDSQLLMSSKQLGKRKTSLCDQFSSSSLRTVKLFTWMVLMGFLNLDKGSDKGRD